MEDINGKDSLISDVYSGANVKILIHTNADMVAIWPGGIREVMKKANSDVDSMDMFNHPVLAASDHYSDYGLIRARGLATTVSEEGWYAFYTYPEPGSFDLTAVITNHGYDGPELKRVIKDFGTITVK